MNELLQIIIPIGGIALSAGVLAGALHLCSCLTRPTAWRCRHCERVFDRSWDPVTDDNALVVTDGICPQCRHVHNHSLPSLYHH